MRNNIITFANNNPELQIKVEIKRCAHPFFRGYYGKNKVIYCSSF